MGPKDAMNRLFTDWKLLFDAWPLMIWVLAIVGFLTGLFIAWWTWYRYASRLNVARAKRDEWKAKLRSLDKKEVHGSKDDSRDAGEPQKLSFIPEFEGGDHDDLTQLEGVDADIASKMNADGIYSFKQFEDLDDSERKKLISKYDLPAINWANWKSKMAGYSLAGLVPAALWGRDDVDVDGDVELGYIYKTKPADADDLTELDGIDADMAAKLNAEGIYTFDQLENLDDDQQKKFGSRFGFPKIDWSWWKFQAKGEADPDVDLDLKTSFDSAPGDADDFTELDGVDADLAANLNAEGIYKFDQLDELDDDQKRNFALKFGLPKLNWDSWKTKVAGLSLAGLIPVALRGKEDVEGDAELGYIYKTKPADADDLTELDGVDADMAAKLNAEGIYTFDQLENLDDDQQKKFGSRFGFPKIDWSWWKFQAKGEADPDVDLGLKTSFDSAPDDADDLTELDGVDADLAANLNAEGIYKFDQLDELDDDQKRNFALKFGLPKLNWDSWKTKVAGLSLAGLIPVALRGKEDVEGDAELGYIYKTKPADADDLTELDGIDTDMAAKLNAEGIYTFDQLENLDDDQRKKFGSRFGFPKIDWSWWKFQAKGEADPSVDLGFDSSYAPSIGEADDLTELEGIDSEMAAKLNAEGIYKFEQLEAMDDSQRRNLGLKFGWPILGWSAWKLHWDERQSADVREEELSEAVATESKDEPVVLDLLGLGDVDLRGEAEKPEAKFALDLDEAPPIAAGFVESEPPVVEPKMETGELAFAKTKPVKSSDDEPESKGIFGGAEDDDDDETDGQEVPVAALGGIAGVVAGSAPVGGGRRTVFVMDVSRSLTKAQLRLSKSELTAAVKSLPETALYQVIFFSGATWFAHQRMVEGGNRGEDVVIQDGDQQTRWESKFRGHQLEGGNENLPVGEWRQATPENIESTLKDVAEVETSFGTTWHLPLTMAMNLEPRPKSIYFLTDGETARQDEVAVEMAVLSKERGAPKIHTIALMVPGASRPLNSLAQASGGTYSLVIGGGRILRDEDLIDYLAARDITLD